MRAKQAFPLALAFALGVVLTNYQGSVQRAEAADHYEGVRIAVQELAAGLSAVDRQRVRAVCTPQLWKRCKPAFKGNPAPGSLGTFTVLSTTPSLNNLDYTTVLMICRHPDGVEDAVRITLKRVNGVWKVCGGPAAATAATPF